MKRYSSRELLYILKRDGWVIKNQEGSHVQLVHPTKKGKVTVKHPDHTIPIKTLRSILSQAGINLWQ